MNRVATCLVLGWLAFAAAAAPPSGDAVTGVWLTATGEPSPDDGYVQIYERDGVYHGRIVGSPDGEARLDRNNPDPAKRDRELLGVRLLEGFEYVGDKRWENGRAYDPNNGKTYDAIIWLEDENTLKLRGYIGVSLFGRTETWTRVGRDAPGLDKDALIGSDSQ